VGFLQLILSKKATAVFTIETNLFSVTQTKKEAFVMIQIHAFFFMKWISTKYCKIISKNLSKHPYDEHLTKALAAINSIKDVTHNTDSGKRCSCLTYRIVSRKSFMCVAKMKTVGSCSLSVQGFHFSWP